MSVGNPIPAEIVLRKAWHTADEFGSLDLSALTAAIKAAGLRATEKKVMKRVLDLREAKVKLPSLPAPRKVITRITCSTAKSLQLIGREEAARWRASQDDEGEEHRFEC